MSQPEDIDLLSARELRERISTGDREIIAAFILKHSDVIRRRAAGRLGTRMRHLFDSQEVLSTVLRRMDNYIKRGNLDVESEAQLMKLMMQMTQAAVVDKARKSVRTARAEGHRPVSASPDPAPTPTDEANPGFMNQAFDALDEQVDQDILWMWLSDIPHTVIADLLCVSPEYVRKRWQRIRETLRTNAIRMSSA